MSVEGMLDFQAACMNDVTGVAAAAHSTDTRNSMDHMAQYGGTSQRF
jgi:hypothetical protein